MAQTDVTEAIMRNARAAERERLRNIALTRWPDLDADAIEDKVRELEIDKLRKAGKVGRAAQQRASDVGRAYLAQHAAAITTLENLLAQLRAIAAEADDQAAA